MKISKSFFNLNSKALKLSFMVFICWVLFFSSSSAQINISTLVEATDELSLENTNGNNNSIELIQQGNSNQSNISQSRRFQYDLPSQAILKQNGFQNIMKINQSTTNGVIVASQKGNNNKIDLMLDGENLKLTTIQEGSNNKILQTLTESTNVELNLIQVGDNNNIEHTLNNQKGLDMTIIQKGQNAAIKVIQN